jgi:signal transduction histidine kinase
VPGTGLGLYVARFIANAYGGSISAENRVPEDHTKGTRMIVMLQKARERDVAELSMRGLTRKRF